MTSISLNTVLQAFSQLQPRNSDGLIAAALNWLEDERSGILVFEPGVREAIDRFLADNL